MLAAVPLPDPGLEGHELGIRSLRPLVPGRLLAAQGSPHRLAREAQLAGDRANAQPLGMQVPNVVHASTLIISFLLVDALHEGEDARAGGPFYRGKWVPFSAESTPSSSRSASTIMMTSCSKLVLGSQDSTSRAFEGSAVS